MDDTGAQDVATIRSMHEKDMYWHALLLIYFWKRKISYFELFSFFADVDDNI